MVRRTNPPQPEAATTPEQALVTPSVRPEVLLAMQHQQATQALHNECAAIRQEIGALTGKMSAFGDSVKSAQDDVSGLKRLQHILIGVGLAIGVVATILWWALGSKVTTLLEMAEEKQVQERTHANGDPNDEPSAIPAK